MPSRVQDCGRINPQIENIVKTALDVERGGEVFGGLTVSGLGFGRVEKSDGDFATTSSTFVDITGLVATVTTGARRARVDVLFVVTTSAAADKSFDLLVDGVSVAGSGGLCKVGGADAATVSFSFVTAALTKGDHVFKVQAKTSAGTLTVAANDTFKAFLCVQEMTVE